MNTYFDEAIVEAQARELGTEVVELWEAAKDAARREAERGATE